MSELCNIWQRLAASQRTLIYTHGHPDADTLGSAQALARALKNSGREAFVTCLDPIPSRLEFLYDGPPPCGFEPTLLCAVDVASYKMLGIKDESLRGVIDIKLDHHRTGDDYAKTDYTDPLAAAAGEIIFTMLAESAPELLTAEVAEPLFAAIASDTGCFRYSNTTAATHRIAAALCDCGIDTAAVNHRLFESRSRGEVAALKRALEALEFHCGGRLALICFTNEDKEKYGFDDDNIAAHSSLTREIEGVELGITLRQKSNEPRRFKASVRSGENVDASALCALFGGGGHIRAAGCELEADSAEEAAGIILSQAKRIFEDE